MDFKKGIFRFFDCDIFNCQLLTFPGKLWRINVAVFQADIFAFTNRLNSTEPAGFNTNIFVIPEGSPAVFCKVCIGDFCFFYMANLMFRHYSSNSSFFFKCFEIPKLPFECLFIMYSHLSLSAPNAVLDKNFQFTGFKKISVLSASYLLV